MHVAQRQFLNEHKITSINCNLASIQGSPNCAGKMVGKDNSVWCNIATDGKHLGKEID